MSESTRIGLGSCPVCASPKAHFTVSRKQLVCVTCNSCNCQIFARSDRSDELLRERLAAPKTEPDPQLTPQLAADPAPPPAPKDDPEPVTEKPKRRSFMSWST